MPRCQLAGLPCLPLSLSCVPRIHLFTLARTKDRYRYPWLEYSSSSRVHRLLATFSRFRPTAVVVLYLHTVAHPFPPVPALYNPPHDFPSSVVSPFSGNQSSAVALPPIFIFGSPTSCITLRIQYSQRSCERGGTNRIVWSSYNTHRPPEVHLGVGVAAAYVCLCCPRHRSEGPKRSSSEWRLPPLPLPAPP